MPHHRILSRFFHRALLGTSFALLLVGRPVAGQSPAAASSSNAGGGGAAQAGANTQAQKPGAASFDPCTATDPLKNVRVCEVWLEKEKGKGTCSPLPDKDLPVVELRDTIAVRVEGLKDLKALESCPANGGRKRNIILFLDHRPLPKLAAAPPSDPKKDVLLFPLARTEDSRDVWTYLLGRPNPFKDPRVEVSVGIEDQFAVPSSASVALQVIPPGWFLFWLLIFVLLVVGFFLLARRSNVLRDPLVTLPGQRPPYSLARTQAAIWFFLILASYLLIGMVTGDFSTSITGTTLVLLGISAGTAVGSAFVDASKTSMTSDAQDAARATALWAEIGTLTQAIQKLRESVRSKATPDPTEANELAVQEALRTEKLSLYSKLTHRSESFLLDILSDNDGVNFHRFQMLAWTIVLGFVFAGQVYRDLAMPQFSETLLMLLGVSSATYLGLKIPENKPSTEVPPPNPGIPNPAP